MLRLASALPPALRALWAAGLLALVPAAAAQVNTERMRPSLDEDGVSVALDASAAFSAGNTDYFQVGVGGRVEARLGADTAFLVGRLDLGKTEGESFLDRSFAHARYTAALGGRLAAEAFGQVERNRLQRLDWRALAGAGLRVTLFEADSAGLALGVTPMVEVEVLDESHGGTEDAVVRVSSYLSGRTALGRRVNVSAVAYAQPRADLPQDVRVLGQAALDVDLSSAVALRVRLTARYDSRPPADVERIDLAVENGLVISIPRL